MKGSRYKTNLRGGGTQKINLLLKINPKIFGQNVRCLSKKKNSHFGNFLAPFSPFLSLFDPFVAHSCPFLALLVCKGWWGERYHLADPMKKEVLDGLPQVALSNAHWKCYKIFNQMMTG